MAYTKLAIAILIPLFLSFSYCIIDVNGEDVENSFYSSEEWFSAGSTIILNHEAVDDDWLPPTPIGKVYLEYTLKDGDNEVVWQWKCDVDEWELRAGFQRVRYKFEFEIPLMWRLGGSRASGQWTLTVKFKDQNGDEAKGLSTNYHFNVTGDGIWDNLNAPIYIYHSKTSFVVFESKFAIQLPPLIMLVCAIGIFIGGILLLKYVRFAVSEGKEMVSLSRKSIRNARAK